ncbi:MAG TPA: RluA family pseudouridine synthase [Blastocatellia bacterium]|jgi:23S rRNA pseudouridine1911/1915/1917 synthase|nr:RluA family pseudouridine synthase [Blastocatellia bacterium]
MLNPDRLSFEFEAGADKPRLDEFVATRLPKISLTRIRRLIAEGDVLLNDERSLKGVRLQPGDRVSVKIFAAEKSSATPEPIPLDILFEDEHIIAVNKPVGLLAHPSNTEKSGTLTNALAYHFWRAAGSPIRPGLIHRLDRNTSGVMVIAKTPRAHRTLSKHFRERRVKKFYLALLSGRMEKDSGEVDAPIGSDPKVWPHWRVTPEGEGGKPAQTLYRVKRRFKAHTLVELEPLTGRTHQLRIHCNLIGHPIVGDPIYASTVDPLAAKHKLKQHLLHAARLVFRHPATGKEMNLEAALPQAMADLMSEL